MQRGTGTWGVAGRGSGAERGLFDLFIRIKSSKFVCK